MKVFLSPEAEQDLVEGGLYYSREASEDLGRALISEFERSAALLAEKPHFGARWLEQVRRLPYNEMKGVRFKMKGVRFIKISENEFRK